MEERYEISAKIGQGGLGAVYRGYDRRMNREVAIKRISVANNNSELQAESTRQLIKEAGALASLQHPHVVTIYDVGSDEDGPYVVMELINGKTLDELIDRAPLTWPDFRQLAIQTMEALIAAQELDLIHGDIKPANLMLTWLPSGKFQIKIVDFGLATLAQSQSAEELEALESVFGSIYFMAPEQFQRVPIDARTDLYAMACVYYQTLTRTYPFHGETTHEVMDSHLHHTVIPIQDLRQGIPLWTCEWIMWMLNRSPDDRPGSAREALQIFLQNDKNPSPIMSLGHVVPVGPVVPRFHLGPNPAKPLRSGAVATPGAPDPTASRQLPRTSTAPQPLLPPEGSKPSVHEPDVVSPIIQPPAPVRTIPLPPKAKPQTTKKLLTVTALLLVLAVTGYFIYDRISRSRASQRHGVLQAEAAKDSVKEVRISLAEFKRFLQETTEANSDDLQETLLLVLEKATPNDDSDFGAAASDFLINSLEILPETREKMIRKGLANRVKPTILPGLVEWVRNTKDTRSAIAILEIIQNVVGDDQFEGLVAITQIHPQLDLKRIAANCAESVIRRSSNRALLSQQLSAAISSTKDTATQELLGRIQLTNGSQN